MRCGSSCSRDPRRAAAAVVDLLHGNGGVGATQLARCGICATLAHMSTAASRDLRNHTAEVLARVAEGDRVTITVNGSPVAELVPPSATRRPSISRNELVAILTRYQADPTLRLDLDALTSETTDDLDDL
jgi:prevent-host-death family protein